MNLLRRYVQRWFSLGLVILATAYPAAAQTVQVLQTNGDQSLLLASQPNVSFASKIAHNHFTITVDDTTQYQTMDGFGAAFTDSSTYLIANKLTAGQRSTLMTNLFSPTSGIGLSFGRLPMGATDFNLGGNYSYDDTAGCAADPTLANFSISHDTPYTVPVIQQALSLNPSLKIEALPWSPPAWMKTTCTMNGGNMNMAYLSPLSNYFVKFLQAYAANGIPIAYIAAQNEPLNSTTSYPSEYLADTDEANFIGNYLGPALASNGLTSTQILVFDHNWSDYTYPINVLAVPNAFNYSAGTSFHCYAGSVSSQLNVQAADPAKGIWFTECSGGGWATNFASNLVWNMKNLFIGSVQNYSKGVLLWNLALDQNSGPQNGGCTNCRGVVTIDDSTTPATISYNVEYYALGQASKFFQPGAVRIGSNNPSTNLFDVAFLNPDNSHVLMVCNGAAGPSTFQVVWNNQAFTYSLPKKSVVTFKW